MVILSSEESQAQRELTSLIYAVPSAPCKECLSKGLYPYGAGVPSRTLTPSWPSWNSLAPWTCKTEWAPHCACDCPTVPVTMLVLKSHRGHHRGTIISSLWDGIHKEMGPPHQLDGASASEPLRPQLLPAFKTNGFCRSCLLANNPVILARFLIPHLAGWN